MKKIRALIVQGFPEVRAALREMIAGETDLVLLGEYGDGEAGLRALREHRPHLLFLGIRLGRLDGFELLDLAGTDAPPAVIFVSVYERYAVRAFSADAVDYLLKPFTRERFEEAVQRARWRLEESPRSRPSPINAVNGSHPPALIGVKANGRIVLLKPDEIEFIIARRTSCLVHTESADYSARSHLSSIQEKLPANRFIRINRSTLVNAAHVKEAARKAHGDGSLRMKSGQEFRLSRRYRAYWSALIRATNKPAVQAKRSSFHGSALFE